MAVPLNIPRLSKDGEPIIRVQLPGWLGRVDISFVGHTEAVRDANQNILASRRSNPMVKVVGTDTRLIAADFNLAAQEDELPDA